MEKFFTKDEMDPCRDAVNDLVEEVAQKLYRTKRIKSTYHIHLTYIRSIYGFITCRYIFKFDLTSETKTKRNETKRNQFWPFQV